MCPQHKQVSVRRSPPGVKSGLSRNGSETQAICRDHGRSCQVCATGMRKGWTLLGHRSFFAVHAQSVRKSHPALTDLHECTCWNSGGFKWRNASALGNYDADSSLGGEHQLFPGQEISSAMSEIYAAAADQKVRRLFQEILEFKQSAPGLRFTKLGVMTSYLGHECRALIPCRFDQ